MPKQLFDLTTEREICLYYWTRLPSGYYPSYKEVGEHFGCSAPHVRNLLKKHHYERRTNAETREKRPCKPITRGAPVGETAPVCACGCGQSVEWNAPNYRWFRYINGHYSGMQRKTVQPKYRPDRKRQKSSRPERAPRARRDPTRFQERMIAILTKDLLTDLYVAQGHTIGEIAGILEVGRKSVTLAMKHHGIPLRTLSENLLLRGSTRREKNPAWKGGVAKWAYAPDWKRLCKQIKDRDKWTCQLCGECRKRWGHSLHVHHIDGDKLNNYPHNLIALCAKCHAPVHADQGAAQKLKEAAIRNTG